MNEIRHIPFGRPWITDQDRKAVMEVLDSPILTHGPQCKSFEQEFASYMGPTAHAVSVSSCMAALHLACLHFGFGPGDEVIVPAQTHTATVHAVEWTGARPVFVDCDPMTGNVTPDRVEEAITAKTKGLLVVHFIGIPCDMQAILEVTRKRGIKVIEDCALALGSRLNGTHVGLFGDAGCFSFYPVKHITTGEGGMFVSRHKEVVDAVAKLRAFGVDRTIGERVMPGYYDVPSLGLNYRMSEMQAALGRTQLSRFPESLERRRSNFARLKSALSSLKGVRVLDSGSDALLNSHYCLVTILENEWAAKRNRIAASLNALGVGTSIYYPHPVPRMTYYREKYGYEVSRFKNASMVSDQGIALPVGIHVKPEDIDTIIKNFKQALEENLL